MKGRRRGEAITNWSRTGRFCPQVLARPTSAEEVVKLLADAESRFARVRVIGSGWSPLLAIVHCEDTVIMMDKMNAILKIDRENKTVTAQGGATLLALQQALEAEGLSFSNMPSVSGQTIAGAIATATHGSGFHSGVLSSAVLELEIATPAKGILRLNRDSGDLFWAACCSLGVLGVVTEVTIQVEDAYALAVEKETRRLDDILANFERIARSADYVRFWWYPHTDYVQLHVARQVPYALASPPARPGLLARLLGFLRHHALQSTMLCTWAMPCLVPLINRIWRRLFFHSRSLSIVRPLGFHTFDVLFRQNVNEWAVPVSEGAKALAGLRLLVESKGYRAHFPVEFRFAPSDRVWLSSAAGRDVCFVNLMSFTPYGLRVQNERKLFGDFDLLAHCLGGRPHWAKPHPLGRAELTKLYPRFEDFRRVRAEVDPKGMLGNDYTDRLFEPLAPLEA